MAGSSITEFLAMVAVVMSVFTVLAAIGLPALILREMQEVIACVADPENCNRSAEGEDPDGRSDSDPLPCTPSSTEEMKTSSTSVLFTHSSSGTRYSVSERPDGAVEILETTSRGRGGIVGAGGGIGKKGGGKFGVDAAATSIRVEETGDIYVLETEEERARFERARSQRAVDAYVHPVDQWKNPDDYERKYEYLMSQFREGSYERVSDNASVDISGGARIVKGHLGIEGETGTVVERYDSGETTVSFDVKASSVGGLGVLVLGATSSSEDLANVSLTTSADGTPTSLVLTTERAVGGGASLELDPTQVVDLPSFVQAAAGWQASEHGENVVRVTAAIPLPDEAARAAALAFVENPGDDMGTELLERFDDSGQGLIEVLQSDTTTDGFGIGVRLLASLGFEDERSVRALTMRDAWGWEPESGLTRRTECVP